MCSSVRVEVMRPSLVRAAIIKSPNRSPAADDTMEKSHYRTAACSSGHALVTRPSLVGAARINSPSWSRASDDID